MQKSLAGNCNCLETCLQKRIHERKTLQMHESRLLKTLDNVRHGNASPSEISYK